MAAELRPATKPRWKLEMERAQIRRRFERVEAEYRKVERELHRINRELALAPVER